MLSRSFCSERCPPQPIRDVRYSHSVHARLRGTASACAYRRYSAYCLHGLYVMAGRLAPAIDAMRGTETGPMVRQEVSKSGGTAYIKYKRCEQDPERGEVCHQKKAKISAQD
eukprot:3097722-Rhodomonas_salina.1